MPEGERRLAAIMFTDIVGYTALAQKDEYSTLQALDKSRSLLRPHFLSHGGREIKTIGDAFLVEFPSALDAVLCAVAIQQVMHDRKVARGDPLSLRIGIHVGDVLESGNDILGDAVNIASRIEPLAEPGGVCVTEQVYDQVSNKSSLSFASLGEKTLKNVMVPIQVYAVGMPWTQSSSASGKASLPRERIAVLPLVNMSGDPSDEFFADGMTEEMISTLSGITGLTVISRTSIMQYKGAKKSLVEIGRELGAGTLLEGSVRKAGNRVRITVQLVDAREDKHLWAQNYDRDLQDIFAVQSDVATNIAGSLKVKLLEGESLQINRKPTDKTEAYLLYLKGRQHWTMRSRDAVYKAMSYFQQAIDSDPGFALAYAGVADCWTVAESWGYASHSEATPKMKAAALRALKLDSKLAEAHTTYALWLGWHDWRWDEAELEFERAIELNPSYSTAHQWYAWSVLRMKRRLDEELREAHKALELDPLAPVMSHNMGQTYYYREAFAEAINHFERAVELSPAFGSEDYENMARCYLATGENEKGIELIETEVPKFKSKKQTKLALAWAYGTAGRIDEAKKMLAEAEQIGENERAPPLSYAWAYLGVGETDRMFECLVQTTLGFETRGDGPFALIDPLFVRRYGTEQRFLDIRKRIGI